MGDDLLPMHEEFYGMALGTIPRSGAKYIPSKDREFPTRIFKGGEQRHVIKEVMFHRMKMTAKLQLQESQRLGMQQNPCTGQAFDGVHVVTVGLGLGEWMKKLKNLDGKKRVTEHTLCTDLAVKKLYIS